LIRPEGWIENFSDCHFAWTKRIDKHRRQSPAVLSVRNLFLINQYRIQTLEEGDERTTLYDARQPSQILPREEIERLPDLTKRRYLPQGSSWGVCVDQITSRRVTSRRELMM
jgi:hypothetical protein